MSEAKSRPVASGTEDRRPETGAEIAMKSLSRAEISGLALQKRRASTPQRVEISITPGFNLGTNDVRIIGQPFSVPVLATPTHLADSIRLALKNGSKWPAVSGQQPKHKNTVFYIPTSNSSCLLRLWGRTRSSQGAGRIRACLLPFTPALTKNVLQTFCCQGFN